MTDFDQDSTVPTLAFTGERFTPECVREIWYEHWHRYAFAAVMARGRRVLDAACGEGYGSALLARYADSVVGVDVDADTVEHARTRYQGPAGLQFQCASVTSLPLADASIDLIVSFETIEHLSDQERMLDEFRRVLAPDGILLISSPDRDNYNAPGTEANPYHVRELTRSEFSLLLATRFPAVRLYGQKLTFQSQLWNLETESIGSAELLRLDGRTGALQGGADPAPVYYLALCAATAEKLPKAPDLSLFADAEASVYAHYNQEVRRVIQCDLRIHELERELSALRARLAQPND